MRLPIAALFSSCAERVAATFSKDSKRRASVTLTI